MVPGRGCKRWPLHALSESGRFVDALRQHVEAFAGDVLFEAAIKLDLERLQVSLGEILRADKVIKLGSDVDLYFHQLVLQFFALFSLD